jgi:cytoplasmic iron level regulating protein YaaA (DUF328/UPF0246 family)
MSGISAGLLASVLGVLILVSPAKSLDLESPLTTRRSTLPRYLDQAEDLIAIMRGKSTAELRRLMGISEELAVLNADRYRAFETPFTPANARPAALTFNGAVYQGMSPRTFDQRDWTEAGKTLRILSGLYGILRPLDIIQPYRLEMGIKIANPRGADLYAFWRPRLTRAVAEDLASAPGARVIVNLASAEYSAAVDLDGLSQRFSAGNASVPGLAARVVSPRFEDRDHAGNWKVISFSAKRARGLMAGWLVRERIRSGRGITRFCEGGYCYAPEISTPETPVFRNLG